MGQTGCGAGRGRMLLNVRLRKTVCLSSPDASTLAQPAHYLVTVVCVSIFLPRRQKGGLEVVEETSQVKSRA